MWHVARTTCGHTTLVGESAACQSTQMAPPYHETFWIVAGTAAPVIALAKDPVRMALAMKHAVIAGREAYLAGRMGKRMYADPSSPLAGLI